jgi:hypothetical protein
MNQPMGGLLHIQSFKPSHHLHPMCKWKLGFETLRLRTSSGADAFSEIFQDLNCFANFVDKYFSKPVNLLTIFSQVSLILLVITKLIRRQIKVTRSEVADQTEVNLMAMIQSAYAINYSFHMNIYHFKPRTANGACHVCSLGEELISLSYHPNQP